MSGQLYRRGPITDVLLAYLVTELVDPLVLVGDGIAPPGNGWAGQPDSGVYQPYLVLTTGQATPHFKQAVRGGNRSWLQAYQVGYYGSSRTQADGVGDRCRQALADFAPDRTINDGVNDWGVLEVEFTSIGGITRNDAVNPPSWSSVDSINLMLERRST